MKYPNNLGKILIGKGIKKSEFKELCKFSYSYLVKIVKGDCDPREEFKNRMANHLDMAVNKIFPDTKKRKKNR